ncbi:MAG: YggS family pyridoxal phosphate-dependent enzyme [Clostridia bacterium]|nr:YggS family pyridoxal phosphate-dependent enzyme [Clostridia bacterium]
MLEENLSKVFEIIKNGNNYGEEITLIGATKTMSVEIINRAVALGLKVVAENRVQEFRDKCELISPAAKQHFIGHLQTNKVKYLVGKVELIHSVDSVHLAEEINRVAQNKNTVQDILIEINVGGELSKSGFSLENAKDAVKQVSAYKNLKIKGLMAMLPRSDDSEFLSNLCKKMRELYDHLKTQGFEMKYLSMGMSNDYQIAIKNGSNAIRLGRTIFGDRV